MSDDVNAQVAIEMSKQALDGVNGLNREFGVFQGEFGQLEKRLLSHDNRHEKNFHHLEVKTEENYNKLDAKIDSRYDSLSGLLVEVKDVITEDKGSKAVKSKLWEVLRAILVGIVIGGIVKFV